MTPIKLVPCANCIHCNVCGFKSTARDIEGLLKKNIEQVLPPLKDSLFSISLKCNSFSSEVTLRERDGEVTVNGVPSQLLSAQRKDAKRTLVDPTAFTCLYDIRD